MRCPECQYALWNLKEPTCPECGRGFGLGEWDFSSSDAGFACAACGDRLPGGTPKELPEACPACGVAVDARAVSVVAGASGRDVPRVADPDRLTRLGGWFCTGVMVLSVCCGGLVLLGMGRNGGHGAGMLMFFAIIGTMAGFAGFWPKVERRRAILVFSLLVLMAVASFVAIGVGNKRRYRAQLPLRYSTMVRGIIQSVEIYRQDHGTFPVDPQAIVDQGYIPIELFYEHRASVPQQLTWTQLRDGWIEVGMFRIDWDESSWVAQSNPLSGQIALIIAAPARRLPATSVGFADMHVEYYHWQRFWSEQPQWDADREAAGLKAIPKAALPTVP